MNVIRIVEITYFSFWFSVKPPFVPHVSSLDDTSNFEEFEKKRYQPSFEDFNTSKEFSGKDLPFVGFTYVRPQNR